MNTNSTSVGGAGLLIMIMTAGWISCKSTGTFIRRLTSTILVRLTRALRLVYRNIGEGKFKDVSAEMGPGISERFSSRGAAFGDYDNDGDVDVLVLNMNDLPSLLRNDGGNKQNWIKIKLNGTKCNRTAIGARVRVVTGHHVQIDEVHSGSSVMSQGDLRLHFGLGKTQTIDLIEVKWPTTGKLERFTQVKANQIVTIREGSGIVLAEGSTAK